MATGPGVARRLFAPIAGDYERRARLLSLGQDRRWRCSMVDGLGLAPGAEVLDLAAGTGSISRALADRGLRVFACDQSPEMLAHGRLPGPAVLAEAERLPFAAESFDGVTFGYLLRYVDDVARFMGEVVRLLRPGGSVGMVEFGRPTGLAGTAWAAYTRTVLPAAGWIIGGGWSEVGRFLGPSIDEFSRRLPPDRLAGVWREAGLSDVRWRLMSLGGGLLMWGRRS